MRRDIIDFSSFCGMYTDGGNTGFVDDKGVAHVITGDGNRPRSYTLDGKPVGMEELSRMTRYTKLSHFRPN